MNSKKFFDWCRTAVGKIWYKPDRDAVHKELYAKMLDHYQRFLDEGFSPEEAEEKTLQVMGDPQQVALQLKKTHKSFWPRLLVTTRWITAVVLALTLVTNFLAIVGMVLYPFYQWNSDHRYVKLYSQDRIIDMAPVHAKDASDTYTFTATEVFVCEMTRLGATKTYVRIDIKLQSLMLLCGKTNVLDSFYVVSSEGQCFYGSDVRTDSSQKCLSTSLGDRTGLWEYTGFVYLIDVDPDTQWLELHYDRCGRDVVLRVDLTEVELQ